MHKPESELENGTQKNLWDFEIQTDHLISARRPDLVSWGEISVRIETIQTTELLRSARILRKVLKTWKNLL